MIYTDSVAVESNMTAKSHHSWLVKIHKKIMLNLKVLEATNPVINTAKEMINPMTEKLGPLLDFVRWLVKIWKCNGW